MPRSSPMYNGISVTFRSAERLVSRHGYPDMPTFLDRLEPNARVLDVGAGLSALGSITATNRPDITWVNMDPAYNDPAILKDASEGAPGNVYFEPMDVPATDGLQRFEPFDLILSFWSFPYIVKDEERAKEAVEQLYDVAKMGGRLSIGPIQGRQDDEFNTTIKIIKNSEFTAEEYATDVIRRIHRLP